MCSLFKAELYAGLEQRRADVTIATKNGTIVLKTGRIAQNCACCAVPPCQTDYRNAVRATVVISGGQDAYLQWSEVRERVTSRISKVTYGSALNGTHVFENFEPVSGTSLLRSRIFLNDPPSCASGLHGLLFTVGSEGFWALTAQRIPSVSYTDRQPAAGVDTSDGNGFEELITPNFQYYGTGISCNDIDNRTYNPPGQRNPSYRPGANCTVVDIANFIVSQSCAQGIPLLPIPPAVLREGLPHIAVCGPGAFGQGAFISGSLHDAGGWLFTPTTFAQLGTETLRYSIDSVQFEF
jgi:hypothetical protein